jgi:hypothetical protein
MHTISIGPCCILRPTLQDSIYSFLPVLKGCIFIRKPAYCDYPALFRVSFGYVLHPPPPRANYNPLARVQILAHKFAMTGRPAALQKTLLIYYWRQNISYQNIIYAHHKVCGVVGIRQQGIKTSIEH